MFGRIWIRIFSRTWIQIFGRIWNLVFGWILIRVLGRIWNRVFSWIWIRVFGLIWIRVLGRIWLRVFGRIWIRIFGWIWIRIFVDLQIQIQNLALTRSDPESDVIILIRITRIWFDFFCQIKIQSFKSFYSYLGFSTPFTYLVESRNTLIRIHFDYIEICYGFLGVDF